jgi:type I restriction enzyme S subunit
MTKLDRLIAKLCPNGVEHKPFFQVADFIRGVTYSKELEVNDGNGTKLLRANNITLATNMLNFDDVKIIDKSVKIKDNQWLKIGDILICAGSGSKDHIGKTAYIFEELDYTFGGFMAVIRTMENLNSRYLFHILTSNKLLNYLDTTLNTSTINNLNAGVMEGFTVPIPPLPIQQEIVRILDNFTKLTAELTARKNNMNIIEILS